MAVINQIHYDGPVYNNRIEVPQNLIDDFIFIGDFLASNIYWLLPTMFLILFILLHLAVKYEN